MPLLGNEKADKAKSDKKAMRKVELKNLADWFLKSPPEKTEKTPIFHISKDNGAIPKISKMGDAREQSFDRHPSEEEKSTTESGEEIGKPKMSILRKLCFLLSLNGGVVYVAAFLWFIPCRMPYCREQQRDWAFNVSGQLTSNMEAVSSSEQLSSVMFGYSDENGGNLAAYSILNGEKKWNTSTNHILRHVFCNYNHLSGKSEGLPKCVVTAYSYIAAVDDSNGKLLWERNLTQPDGEVIHRVSMAGNSNIGFYILGVSDVYLFVVDARNGSQVAAINLPCSWTVDVKLMWPLGKGKEWILVCEYGDSIEVWTFEEKELLPNLAHSQENSTEKNTATNQDKFKLLFNRRATTGSIDLSGDVTRTPDSLVLSWADSVVMVTIQAPPSRPAWEVRAWDTIGQPAVTSILSGHFTDPDKIQIAVAVQDGYNATIHVLDGNNGTSIVSTPLGSRSIMSMEKITGAEGETDSIVLESVHNINSKNVDTSNSEALPSLRTYFTMQYRGKEVVYQNIATSKVYESVLVPYSAGAASLLIASRIPEGGTTLARHVITSQQQESSCHWGIHHNTTTLLLMD